MNIPVKEKEQQKVSKAKIREDVEYKAKEKEQRRYPKQK